jgi:hypothetical protein
MKELCEKTEEKGDLAVRDLVSVWLPESFTVTQACIYIEETAMLRSQYWSNSYETREEAKIDAQFLMCFPPSDVSISQEISLLDFPTKIMYAFLNFLIK